MSGRVVGSGSGLDVAARAYFLRRRSQKKRMAMPIRRARTPRTPPTMAPIGGLEEGEVVAVEAPLVLVGVGDVDDVGLFVRMTVVWAFGLTTSRSILSSVSCEFPTGVPRGSAWLRMMISCTPGVEKVWLNRTT
jgi:hypothetical protein